MEELAQLRQLLVAGNTIEAIALIQEETKKLPQTIRKFLSDRTIYNN